MPVLPGVVQTGFAEEIRQEVSYDLGFRVR